MLTYIISRSLEHERCFLRQRRKGRQLSSPSTGASEDKVLLSLGSYSAAFSMLPCPKPAGAAGIPLGIWTGRTSGWLKLHGGLRGVSGTQISPTCTEHMCSVQSLCTRLGAHPVAWLCGTQSRGQGKLPPNQQQQEERREIPVDLPCGSLPSRRKDWVVAQEHRTETLPAGTVLDLKTWQVKRRVRRA